MAAQGVKAVDTIDGAAARASDWLAGLADGADGAGTPPLAGLLEVLVGCWICARGLAVDAGRGRLHAVAREVMQRLQRRAQGHRALLRCDAALVLVCAGILRAQGYRSATLESFIRDVAASLPTRGRGRPDLFPVRFLLHRLGLHRGPGRCEIGAGAVLREANPFRGDESAMRSFASQVAAATSYGQTVCSRDTAVRERLAMVAPVWMLSCLREYDLELGALLLRTMGYLKLRQDRVFREGIDFLLEQQQPAGRFGFLARDLAGQRAGARRDAAWALYVPITVCCLWAIAEASNPGFVLLQIDRTT
jgi:hypothetical protein